jgi:hypothetical protein
MSIPNYDPRLDPDDWNNPRLVHCLRCDKLIEPGTPLQVCPTCIPAFVSTRSYLEKYTARVRKGWLPDSTTPAPMTPEPVHQAWMTAGDLAEFNRDWQRARFTPICHGFEVLAAFRHGSQANTVVLLVGHQYPLGYYVVSAAARLDLWLPSADEDTWEPRKFGPTMIPRNFVYDAALTYSYVLPQMIEPNNNVNPLRLTITFYNGETRLATVVNSWDRASAGRKVKILAYHDITVPASAAGVWAYTDALRDMANHLGTLARCGKGW